MSDKISKAFDQLDDDGKRQLLSEILSRVQLSGGGSGFEDGPVKGYGYGGRLGYRQPIGEDALTLGISGGGYKVKTPYGDFSGRALGGADLGYNFGPNDLSARYNKGQIPVKDLLQIMYQRKF